MAEITIKGGHAAEEMCAGSAIGDYAKQLADKWFDRGWIEPVMKTREIVDSLSEMVEENNPGLVGKYDETLALLLFCSYLVDKGYASTARYLGNTIVLDKEDSDEDAWESAAVEFENR